MRNLRNTEISLTIILALQLIYIAIIYYGILAFNDGHFVYSFDDPYIFLATAKHHFLGVTPHIRANVSSSLLGMYILTPFQSLFGIFFPFYLNIVVSIINTILFWKIINFNSDIVDNITCLVRSGILIFMILMTSELQLIFSGMEHNIELLLCTIAFLGVLYSWKYQRITGWFLACIIVLPLWRYDCLSLCIPLLLYLYFKNHIKLSFICMWTISIVITLYFAWWHSMGLPFFPNSLIVRSRAISAIEIFLKNHHITTTFFIIISFSITYLLTEILYRFRKKALSHTNYILQILILFILIMVICLHGSKMFLIHIYFLPILCILVFYFFSNVSDDDKLLAGLIILHLFLSALFSGATFLFRINSYQFIFPLLGIYFFFYKTIFFQHVSQKISSGLALFLILLIFLPYINPQLSPIDNIMTSNAIYRQQYQMARFVKDYYKGPVAVNDLGLVAYYSPYTVVDLCGIGRYQPDNYDLRLFSPYCNNRVASAQILQDYQIHLLMVYHSPGWIEKVPNYFVPIARLTVLPPFGTLGDPSVYFFVQQGDYVNTYALLKEFQKTLPKGVYLEFFSNNFQPKIFT